MGNFQPFFHYSGHNVINKQTNVKLSSEPNGESISTAWNNYHPPKYFNDESSDESSDGLSDELRCDTKYDHTPKEPFDSDAYANQCIISVGNSEKFDLLLDGYIKSKVDLAKREVFIKYISYAVPDPLAINYVYNAYLKHINLYPNAKLIDLGAGSGVFTWLFNRKGIPADKLVALDLNQDDKTHTFELSFWPTTTAYKINKDDIIFIAWGIHRMEEIVDNYILDGGRCVIIQGEYGCTFQPDFISDNSKYNTEWITSIYRVAPGLSCTGDDLTVNTKYGS